MDATPPWKKSYYYRPGYLLPCIMNGNTIDTVCREFEVRDDDVFLITYCKSGTAWTYEILTAILHADDDPASLENAEFKRRLPILEFGPADHPDLIDSGIKFPKSMIELVINDAPSPRVIPTHLLPELLPTKYLEHKPKSIFVGRHPKDVLVSLHAYHSTATLLDACSWESIFEEFLKGGAEYGPFWDYVQQWSKYMNEPWMLWLKFEDMKSNPKQSIKQIADFLGRPLTEEQLTAIQHRTSFKVMKEQTENRLSQNIFVTVDGKVVPIDSYPRQRKGIVGDWKNKFTVAQNEAFDKVYEEKMKGYEHLKYQY